jgi:hypothetical protein
MIIEHIFLYLAQGKLHLSYSALSTAIGVIFMLYSQSLYIYIFLIALGLLQKHFLKHLFNPSNFAMVMGLLLFYNQAHIVVGGLGDEVWFGGLVSILALVILVRVGRWIIPLTFFLSYAVLEYYLVVLDDPILIFENFLHRFYSITLILFIYFMLTDPSVTPKSSKWQIVYGFGVALIASLLDREFGYRVQHLFMALFLISPLFTLWSSNKRVLISALLIIIPILGYIEIQSPYYLEMSG